jgi:hypothetical protein
MRPLITAHASGETRGVDPSHMGLDDLREAGHLGGSLMRVIRAKCLDCSAGSRLEVRACAAVRCALWPYRMGRNPFKRRKRAENPAPIDEFSDAGERGHHSTKNSPTAENPPPIDE